MFGETPLSGNAVEHYVDNHVERGDSQRTAFITSEQSWTYGALLDHVERRAALLRQVGLKPGSRLAIVLPDSLEAVAFLLAAIRIGAVPAPIHTRLTDREYRYICADSEPTAAVVTGNHVGLMRDLQAQVGSPHRILVVGCGTDLEDREAVMVAAALKAIDGHRGVTRVNPCDPALLQYTSGSTGMPKGVLHLHRGLLALPLGFGRRLALTGADVCYSTAKLSFGYGLGNSVLFPLSAGSAAYLRAADSDPLGVLKTIDKVHPTVLFAGPALYRAMLGVRAAEHDYDLSSIRLCVSAGDTLGAILFESWRDRFGHEILDGLGSTECLHIFMAGEQGRLHPGCVGQAISPYEARLTHADGNAVARGEVGHLHVRGPANFARYWRKPRETTATILNGWVRTGDLMSQQAEGCFHYVGRSDDVFKIREQKVSPVEIEELLNTHPAVSESAVVEGKNARGFAVVCGFVRVADGHSGGPALTRALRASLRTSLSPHKIPQVFRYVENLPRTSTGKLERRRLRVLAQESSLPRGASGTAADR
jgi:benzoate-CoA ligase family protein